jgi:hypothetical protein
MKHKTLYDERFSILGIFRWRLFHSLAPQLLLGASPILAQLLENVLPIRIGSDQTGNSKFTGEIASVRFYSRTLLSNEVARLYQAGPEASLMPAIFAWHSGEAETLTNGLGQGSGDWSVEAWIHPVPGETGRIVDKITPGGADGFMLDTYPGKAIRLICGEAQMSVPVTFTGQWVHVVAAMENSGALSLFVNGVRHGEDGTPDGLLYRGSVAPPESPLTAWYLRPAARWTARRHGLGRSHRGPHRLERRHPLVGRALRQPQSQRTRRASRNPPTADGRKKCRSTTTRRAGHERSV